MPKVAVAYLSKPELARRYGVSSRTIDRWRTDGLFPAPDITLPSGAPRWRDATVTAHERRLVGKQQRSQEVTV
jgi:predicted DNA-binding transcriptional regulator AlpA